jgi:CubicO group peptidase (beta-lactamase class C family)
MGGTVSPDFGKVHEEFVKNFAERGDLGAACTVYHRGRKVVDLWGGYRNAETREPWDEDTLVLVFSTTKGLAAMVMAVAHSRGYFDFDDPICRYWPQFAQNGKHKITIRQLLAHQAGLPAIDQRLDASTLGDLDRLAPIVAKQRPAWQPGSAHGYHTLTLGWYQNELIRRVDPQHRSLGRFFQEEIALPLGVEFYIGLPRDVEEDRVAAIQGFHPLRLLLQLHTMPTRMILTSIWPRSLSARSVRNPRFRKPEDMGSPEYRHLELPSANGIGQVRAIAKAYSVFAEGGRELDLTSRTIAELTAPADTPPAGTYDVVLKLDARYSHGFIRPSRGFPFGKTDSAFGSPGAGGSFGFADPEEHLGYAYASNKMGFYLFDDPREKALRNACCQCLAEINRRRIPDRIESRPAA